MSMMVPVRRQRSLLSDLMSDPFETFFSAPQPPQHKPAPQLMRTDIRETESGFELTIDLPGFKRENVSAELKDRYLRISAQTVREEESSGETGTYIRKERFSGTCSRTFYVGEEIEEDEIRAKFEDGTLKIAIPKKQEEEPQDTIRTISIS